MIMEYAISAQVYKDIKDFLFSNIDVFRKDAEEYDGLDITIATTDGNSWGYQTGDNSYTGGAYPFQHWGVTTITPDSDPLEIYDDITDQLEELMAQ